MKYLYHLLFLSLLITACSPEKEILIPGNQSSSNPIVGVYSFDLTVTYGSSLPDISTYLPPKKFTTDILKSENYREISLLNIHDSGMCIYAKITGSSIEIPLQDLRLMPEAFGFTLPPGTPATSVFIMGSGSLSETARTADDPEVWEMEIEYQLLHEEEILWNVTGKAERTPLQAPMEFTCQ